MNESDELITRRNTENGHEVVCKVIASRNHWRRKLRNDRGEMETNERQLQLEALSRKDQSLSGDMRGETFKF